MSTVLERNVRLLLRRSYVPALPAPPFRDRLEALFLAEVERRAARAPRRARFPQRVRLFVALAAAVLALFIGWRLFGPTAGDARARLLERGEVALGLPDGSWRAANEGERAHGLAFAPPSLAVLTPERVEIEVRIAAGLVHVDPRSEVALEQRENEVVATLRAGSGWFLSGEERSTLARGEARVLRPPTPELVATHDGAATPAPREAVAPHAPEAPASSAPARVLSGVLVVPEGEAMPSDFRVALLAERTGNETPPPVVRDFTGGASFRWPDPPAGKQRVFVHAEGYALCALGEFDLSRELPALRAELVTGVTVRGSVLDDEGNPVPDALVIAEDETPSDGLLFSMPSSALHFWLPIHALTGPDGRFELAHLNPGTHTLRAGAADFAPGWQDGVRVPSADGAEVDFELGPGGTVSGIVTREDGGPRAGAQIVIVAMNEVGRARTSFDYTNTDAEGRYRFEHLPVMTMIVVMVREDAPGDERPEVRPVQVVEGATVTADFKAARNGARLHGRLLAHDGRPLARQNLGLFDSQTSSWNQDWVATTSEADGSYAFEGVPAGRRYQFFLIDEMGRGLRCVDEFDIASGSVDLEREVRIPVGRIGVTAFDARGSVAGDPLAETALIAMKVEDDGRLSFSAFGLSDADGHFEFVDLRPGTYFVVAYPTRAGLGFAQSERVTLDGTRDAAAPPELEIGLEAGVAVSVRVRDSEGHPLEGVSVVFEDEGGGEHTFSRLPMTDAEGRYRAVGLHPGRYRVVARLAGYQGTPVEFRGELGREPEVPVVLTPIFPR